MVELRKRPPPKETPEPAAKRSASKPRSTVKKVIDKAKAVVTDTTPSTAAGDEASSSAAAAVTEPAPEVPATGQIPETVGAGTSAAPAAQTTATTAAENNTTTATTPFSTASINKSLPSTPPFTNTTTLTLHTGTTTTFATLLTQSQNGIIIFTYPKASTPGCTTQACLFRDNYTDLRDKKGYSVYGLSNDSVKANSGFVSKQGLGYELICDPDAELSHGLGMKKAGAAKGCVRGVVVIDKDGRVRVWMQGGPGKTLDAVREFVGN